MCEDDVKALDDWFKCHEHYGTYHHTEEKDGEDIYAVNISDMELFCDYLRENVTDFVGIPCMTGKYGIWFTSKDLEKVEVY